MEKFAAYLDAIDGTGDWSVIGPLFDAAFHPDCVVVTADGEYTKQEWSQMAKRLADKGAAASGFAVTSQDGDTAYYEVTITVDDAPMHMTAKGTLHDGRLIRVEPVDPALYSSLMEKSK